MSSAVAKADASADIVAQAAETARAGEYDFDNCLTRRTGRNHLPDVAAALVVAQSSMSDAADLLRVRYEAIKKFVQTHEPLKHLLREMRERMLDKVERSQVQAALDGDHGAQRFLLATLGKNRGYSRKVEMTHEADNDKWRDIIEAARNPGHLLPCELMEKHQRENGQVIDVEPTETADSTP
ncbi:hypothetical protein [Candidatus Rariloculus sp.]|uniref:hypothetical protein n=1 Tax=Candidatus Rariloculus sp. TaxID=3101265 RepID=UPI003D0FF30C